MGVSLYHGGSLYLLSSVARQWLFLGDGGPKFWSAQQPIDLRGTRLPEPLRSVGARASLVPGPSPALERAIQLVQVCMQVGSAGACALRVARECACAGALCS